MEEEVTDLRVQSSNFLHQWSSSDIARFIQARGEAESLFTGQRNSLMEGWKQVLSSISLATVVSPLQARKKWDNLEEKYLELKCPPIGAETDNGEDAAASWPWYPAMDALLGQRHSITPPVLRASMACSSSMAGPYSTGAIMSSPPPREERQEGRGRKRRYTMAFLLEMMERGLAREEERQRKEEERQQKVDERLERLLTIMERLAEK
ncbi:uncharacterized protein LOC116220615 [Clupea harengus]|uniref:Uncharacterized protein LOC116220615 n=1 Tax=Clupea harengus TaxID=7950 RepID=A0A6P8F7F6_CLUHA|nr:uncharacterized protein LOC116220615 [Clupea harengus]